MSAPSTPFDRIAAVATLGTRRAPLPKEAEWPDPSLSATAEQGSAETRLLRLAAANALWDMAGARAAPEAKSGATADFPVAAAGYLSELAAWRLARIVGGEHAYLLEEWFELAAATGRSLPPHWLPLVLENVTPAARRHAAGVLGPAAHWLAARHPRWLAQAPVAEPSDQRWKEGSTAERVAELESVRALDRERSRAWLRATWEQDPPDAREAFVTTLLPTVAPDDEEFLEMALDDKRKAVRQAAAEGLARLPSSAHARRILERLAPLVSLGEEPGGLLGRLRKRSLLVELPTKLDKAAQRDGIEVKPPAIRKIGERAFWLMQMVACVPPRHWCERFDCDPETFLQAAMASDFGPDLLGALSEAAARHPEREWTLLLARAWIESRQELTTVLASIIGLLVASAPADRPMLVETLVRDAKSADVELVESLLSSVDLRWSPTLTELAFDQLARQVGSGNSNYTQPRNSHAEWAQRCDVGVGARRAALLLEKCGESHHWHNALENFNDIVAFRAAMQEEIRK